MDAHFRQYLEAKYSPVALSDQEKMIEAMVGMLELGRTQKQQLHYSLDKVAHVIYRSLAFDEVVIGLYDRNEKSYYPEIVFGFRNDVAVELKRQRFSHVDMASQERSHGVKVGRFSEFYPAESLSESKLKMLNISSVSSGARRSPDEFQKGGFIRTWIRGPRNDLMGWIEVSRPRDSKFPPKMSVLWLELIATICACEVSKQWHHEDRVRG
jgi:hypothetical protein